MGSLIYDITLKQMMSERSLQLTFAFFCPKILQNSKKVQQFLRWGLRLTQALFIQVS